MTARQSEDGASRALGDYGSCAEIPMEDAERDLADAMAREKCADSSCDTKDLLLARRILDLLGMTS